ncbi:MAG: fused MFS/spermidine synthase, partial [Candidatus Pacebacteria bacterium]|nr:fused MFS/spermidine synthase [Candidatus Paceibacterota bacterium]
MTSKITLFITGASVMILQIIGVRILATQLGTTIAVWSCMIAVTITALAIGYYIGGYYADKGTQQKIRAIFVAGAGITVLLIIPLKEVVFMIGSSLPYGVRATIVSFILFAIPTILLAMTTTYTTRMELNTVAKTGSNSGTLYA